MNIAALRARIQELQAKGKAICDAADKDSNGVMSADQRKAFDELLEQIKQADGDIKRLEALEAVDMSAGRSTQPAKPAASVPAKTRAEVVGEAIENDPMRGFRDAADVGLAVFHASQQGGYVDPRLARLRQEVVAEGLEIMGAPTNFHKEGGSSDGYMVPPAMREEIWRLVFEDEGILPAVAPEPTSSNAVELLRDESTPWGAAGIQAKWESEGGQFDPSRLATNGSTVKLHKLFAFVTATEELLEDAPRLGARLTDGAAAAIRFKSEQAIVEGDGVGKPLGWMKAACLVTVTKESGQAADTVVAGNVAKMYSRLIMAGARNPFWLANQEVLPQLMTMSIANQPIWTPPSEGFKVAPGGFLLGRPVLFSEHCEQLGDKGDIQLVAPNGYYATTKAGGIKFASSIHLYFDYDIQAFRWTFRLGGQPYLSAAVAKNKGSSTLSHFVTLEART